MPWIPITLGLLVGMVLYLLVWIYLIRKSFKTREELFQIVTENAADMIALVDVKGKRLYNSPAYQRILGYSAAELNETSWFEQIHPDDRFQVLEAAREARETGVGKRLEYRITHKDGSWHVLESAASTIRDRNGDVAKLVIVNRDVTERKRAEQQFEYSLVHDSLTGLPNRRWFLDRLQHFFATTRRIPEQHCALLLINVDHFKTLNERMGSAAGDEVLQKIALRIAGCLEPDAAVAGPEGSYAEPALSRLGGDEFTLLLDAVDDPGAALRVAGEILRAVAEPLLVDGQEVRVSVSVGIAPSTHSQERPEDMIKDADAAMRACKALGGSRCKEFDGTVHARDAGRVRLETDLRTALAERQFRIYYQPILQLDTRRVVSLEALLRWEHPTQGLISPDRFLDAAEDAGLLVTMGRWLTLEACRQLREWDASNLAGPPLNLTVNLSARQFADARLIDDLQDALRETGIDASRIQVEITESVAAADPKLTATVLAHLKHLGIGVILDHFGEESGSLNILRRLSLSALKLSLSLTREMQTDRTAADMVEAIVNLAYKMNMKVTVEGVETAKQVERLRELGCEFGQGSYLSQPLEPKSALEFLQDQAGGTRSSRASAS